MDHHLRLAPDDDGADQRDVRGSGAPVPDLSIEVDDLDAALARVKKAKIPIEYGPADEPWGVRRFFVRDPFGTLVNILVHADAHTTR